MALSRWLFHGRSFDLGCVLTNNGSNRFADLIQGFPFSFGVFQEYYTTHEPFSLDPSGIAAIGTSSTGIMYLSCPFLFAAFRRWPQIRRSCLLVGLVCSVLFLPWLHLASIMLLLTHRRKKVINTVAIIASSFATAVSHLILTQGIMYALGGVAIYCPSIVFLDEWFIARKG